MNATARSTASPDDPPIVLRRRNIDAILIGVGAVLTVALVVAGALLLWGSRFSDDYVHDELSSQNITFPSEEELREEGRDDLVKYAGQALDTGDEAEAYASYIDGHLENIAGGQTYAEMGDTQDAARAAVQAATAANAPADEIARLQAEANRITGQRDSLFKGETLRGLLLSAYAWSTVGKIAGYAAYASFAAAAVMLVLVLLGIRHHRKVAA